MGLLRKAGRPLYTVEANAAYPKVSGVGGAVFGSTPTVGTTAFKMQFSSSVITTDASGNATINFPTAFPNGVAMVVAAAGDGAEQISVIITGQTLSSFPVTVRSPTGAIAGTIPVRINWIAIGF